MKSLKKCFTVNSWLDLASLSLIFSQPEVPLSWSVYFRKVALFYLLYPLPWRPLPPSNQLEKGSEEDEGERGRRGGVHLMFGQTDNPNRIYRSTACGCAGLAEAQLTHKHSCAHTHVYTQSWECSRWRAKSPFLQHIYSLLVPPSLLSPFPPSHPSTAPSFRPLFLLHPSFLFL